MVENDAFGQEMMDYEVGPLEEMHHGRNDFSTLLLSASGPLELFQILHSPTLANNNGLNFDLAICFGFSTPKKTKHFIMFL